MPAQPYTGLSTPDVFYFGNVVGDGADPSSPGTARPADVLRTRLAMGRGPSGLTNSADYNKDGRVNSLDLAIVRRAVHQSLPLLTAPAASAPAEVRSLAKDVGLVG